MSYLLRVEAVNLDSFVYDTNKIQPIRGGGYLLLEAVQDLADEKLSGLKLTKISSGASIGLFKFESPDPQLVCERALQYLNTKTGNHATFVVDWGELNDFAKDLQTLMAKNHWRQYQQPTLVLPTTSGSEECTYDGLRPGVISNKIPDDKNASLSESVDFRREEGSKLKKGIYRRILDEEVSRTFTSDLRELAELPDMGNLNNKIAFIYLDGNKFTRVRNERCKSAVKLQEFSAEVDMPRKAFLRELLSQKDNDFIAANGSMRLETLLWGGDELEIIVPAWKGLTVVDLLYSHLSKSEFDGVPLTYAGGVIFCSSKAPILQVRRMARELADNVKDSFAADMKDISKIDRARHNALRVMVMESFDTLGSEVTDFASSYYGKDIWSALLISHSDIKAVRKVISTMKHLNFPRNKMFDIARAIKFGKAPNDMFKAACKGSSEPEELHKVIVGFIGLNYKEDYCYCDDAKPSFRRWFLLNELWDYVVGGETI